MFSDATVAFHKNEEERGKIYFSVVQSSYIINSPVCILAYPYVIYSQHINKTEHLQSFHEDAYIKNSDICKAAEADVCLKLSSHNLCQSAWSY